jgi:hypothetical protein
MPWSVDTLRIRVDLASLTIPPDGPHGWNAYRDAYRDLVRMTLWCGLRNASNHRKRARFVDFRLTGQSAFADLDGVYSLTGITPTGRAIETLSIHLPRPSPRTTKRSAR